MDFERQICLLTGATGGIGKAMAQALSAKGVRLILQGRDREQLTFLNQMLGGNHVIAEGDITLDADRHYIAEICQRHGPISMLINNAGIGAFTAFSQATDEQISRVMQTNLIAPILLTQTLLPQLLSQAKSTIVNVGSAFGSIGFPYQSLYCATKFGVKGFTESLHREMAGTGAQVLYLAPRATRTKINSDAMAAMNAELNTPVDEPDVVASALIKQLSSSKPRFAIGFPERFFAIINAVIPALVDHALIKQLPVIKRYAKARHQEVLP